MRAGGPGVLAALFLVAGGCGGGGGRAPGLELRALGLPVPLLEPGEGDLVVARWRLRSLGPSLLLENPGFRPVGTFGDRPPLRRARLVLDADGDGAFDPRKDPTLGALFPDGKGRFVPAAPFRRALPALGREDWLVVADLPAEAMGAAWTLALTFDSVRDGASGTGMRVRTATALAGAGVRVRALDFAADYLAEGGGARAALRVSGVTGLARILAGPNPVTRGRSFPAADGSGVIIPLLLPPLPPGPLVLRGLDGKGRELFRLDTKRRIGRGRGPARFLDASLTGLPRSHGFSQDATISDLDGDGRPDICLPSYAGQRDRVLRNLGGGRFEDVGLRWLPDRRDDTVHIEACDVDGDGDPDLLLAVEGGQNRLYLNEGDGRMRDVTATHLPLDDDYSEDLRAGDVDGDGDLDFVTANLVDPKDPRKGGRARLYLNRGNGVFDDGTAGRIPPAPTRTYDVEFADFDGDGDLDLFQANYGEPCTVLENDGRGRFLPAGTLGLAPTTDRGFHTSAAVGDLDGDGRLDVLVGTFQGQSFVLRNHGGLRLAEDRRAIPAGEMSTYDVALADLDGDGDLDAFFANSSNPSVLMLNDGKGRFEKAKDFHSPDDKAYDIEVFDADGDGALDLFVAVWGDRQDALYLSRTKTPGPKEVQVLRVEPNYGPPGLPTYVTIRGRNFVKGMKASIGGRPVTGVSLWNDRQMNGWIPPGAPGEVDLTVTPPGGKPIRVQRAFGYEVPPKGAFLDATPLVLGSEPRSTASVAAGDVDGDGLPDLVFADTNRGARLRLSKKGGLMRKGTLPKMSASANEVELADLNGDGRLDLIVVDAGGKPWILEGGGNGSFKTPLRPALPSKGAEEVAVGDLDGDGDLDLVFAVGGPEVVLRNDGGMKFVPLSGSSFAADDSRGLVLGDFDGDGDRDLVVGNFKQPLRLYLNDGKGRFAERKGAFPARPGDQTYAVAAADVDGDGDLDLAVANGGAQVNRLFLGDGRGRFLEAPIGVFRPALGGGAHVVFGDVDLDGDPDLFASHFWGNNHLYWWGDGRLSEKTGMLPTTAGGFAGAAFADLDGDGDLDLVLAGFWGGCRVLLNPLR